MRLTALASVMAFLAVAFAIRAFSGCPTPEQRTVPATLRQRTLRIAEATSSD
jgi:hypothetical protein